MANYVAPGAICRPRTIRSTGTEKGNSTRRTMLGLALKSSVFRIQVPGLQCSSTNGLVSGTNGVNEARLHLANCQLQ